MTDLFPSSQCVKRRNYATANVRINSIKNEAVWMETSKSHAQAQGESAWSGTVR